MPTMSTEQLDQQHQQHLCALRPQTRLESLVPSEIVRLIGSFMSLRSLLNALGVCHQWHNCLLPLVCVSLKVNAWNPLFKREEYKQHLLCVKYLDITFVSFSTDRTIDCPNLLSLKAFLRKSSWSPHWYEMDFLMQAPKSLQCLRIENNTSTELLDALVFFEHLEELHLSLQNCTPPKWVDLYEPLWSRLRVLSMNLIDADQDDDSLANTASMERLRQAGPTRLTELNLNLSVNYEISSFYPFLVELMLKSPNLVRLGWTFRLCSFPVTPKETFANALRSRQMCKQIEYLDFRGDFLDHTDLEVMLETTTGLKGLQLDCYSFDERSWAILKGNFPRCLETLTYLDVRGCSVPAEMAIEMLFTFMNLETFMAVGIKDTDIERARVSQGPWVCRRLTRLQLGVIPAADGTVPHFLAQVALLDRLEIWSLDFYFQRRDSYDIGRHRPGDRNIELSLETGLDTLKNLRNLKVFEGSVVAYKKIHWQEAEVQWVLKHWVSLETIRNVSIERGDWAALKKQYITKR